jgi:branched-chain amino acid transport system permease protein
MSVLIASQLLNGFATGMLYALVAVGLTLVLGILNIPNFAHGVLYALGAYLTYTVAKITGSFYLAILIGPLLVVLVGFALESTALRRLYAVEQDYQLLFLFAVGLIIQEGIVMIWGPVGFSVLPPPLLAGAVDLGFTIYPIYRLAVIVVTSALVFGLWFLLTRTSIGAIVRAGIEKREMVSILGININRVFLFTFGLGTYLAGLAGGLATPIFGLTPSMGLDILPICFVVVVVAGLGSIVGAIFAGILIGIAQSATSVFYPEAAQIVIYLLMGLVLILRPQGLFGTR